MEILSTWKINEEEQLIEQKLYLPLYELLLEMNDIFNSLEARNQIPYLERKTYIDHMQNIAKMCVRTYLDLNINLQ